MCFLYKVFSNFPYDSLLTQLLFYSVLFNVYIFCFFSLDIFMLFIASFILVANIFSMIAVVIKFNKLNLNLNLLKQVLLFYGLRYVRLGEYSVWTRAQYASCCFPGLAYKCPQGQDGWGRLPRSSLSLPNFCLLVY